MKNLSIVLIALILAIPACKKTTSTNNEVDQKPAQIIELTTLSSYPNKQFPFEPEQINRMLKDWKEVSLEQFYYENPKSKVKFPYQEGTFEDSNSEKGIWRYYSCAGLRISRDGNEVHYFVPADEATSLSKTTEKPIKMQNKSQ